MFMPNNSLPNIVVVGAGSAGSRAVYQLTKQLDTTKFNLVVVNPRPYTILYPATARVVVSDTDDIKDRVFVPIENVLKGKGTFILGKVTRIKPNSTEGGGSGGVVQVSTGEDIPYRTLILSPGVSWDNPLSFPEGADGLDGYLISVREALERAENIVLVGAGAVGCELAGEIRDIFPEKKVSIVHGGVLPLNEFYPDRYRTAVRRNFEKRDIEFILNEYIDTIPELDKKITKVTTRSGEVIRADLVISTRGQRIENELFVDSFGSNCLAPKGRVNVEPTFQLPGHPEIFVIGDVIDWDEQKQSFKAQAHADIAVFNVLSLLKGQNKMKKYTGTPELLILTNGKGGGVSYINFFGEFVFGDWFTRVIKSKTLIIPMLLSKIGL